jgi:hypothetical protein
MVIPVEKYSPERKAEFLLSNAVDKADYRKARIEVQKVGLNQDSIPHRLEAYPIGLFTPFSSRTPFFVTTGGSLVVRLP